MAYRASAVTAFGTVSTASPGPVSVVSNQPLDIVQLYVFTDTNVTLTCTGFTIKGATTFVTGTRAGQMTLMWKRISGSSDTGSYSVVPSGSTGMQIGISSHSGRVTTGDPYTFFLGWTTAGATQPTTPSPAQTAAAGDDLCYAPDEWNGVANTLTTTGYTRRIDDAAGMHVFTEDNVSAGSQSPQCSSAGSSDQWYTLFAGLTVAGGSTPIGWPNEAWS